MRLAIACLLVLLPGLTSGQTLLDWNFDDGTMGPFVPLGAGWQVVDGTLHCHTEGYATFSAALAGDPFWSDYIVSFDVRAEGGVNHILRLRVADFQDYYEVNVRAAPFNDVTLGRMDYLGYTFLHEASFATEPGVWHNIVVMVEDYTISVTVDGQHALTFVDPVRPTELRTGSIALVSLSGGLTYWQDIWFDNVVVTALVVPVAMDTWSGVKQLFR